MIRCLLLVVATLLLAADRCSARDESFHCPEAQQRKAATVYNLCKFIHWPESVNSRRADFNICVPKGSNMYQEMSAFNDRRVGGRPIQILEVKPGANGLEQCRALFLSADIDSAQFEKLFTEAAHLPLLTISDVAGFAGRNGMIELVRAAERVHFIINRNSVRNAGLSVAAALLNIAATVPDATR